MSAKGRFVWYDLMTTDVGGAIAFYTETIGWKVQHWGDEPAPYRMFAIGEKGVGGVMALPDELSKMGVPPHFMAYVAVENVDAAAKKAAELGGKVMKEPADIENVGRFAVITDPQGAAIALFHSSSDWKMPERGKQGTVGWHELATTDADSAWKFYSQLFGWKHSSDFDMGEMGAYRLFKHPEDGEGIDLGGMGNMAKHMGFPPHWLYYVNVDDIDAALKRVTDKGGKILNGPMEVPGGSRVAQCQDPQGGAFGLLTAPKK